MRDILFNEIRKSNREIENVIDEIKEEENKKLICQIEAMCNLYRFADAEGLLFVEEEVKKEKYKDFNGMEDLISLIIEGVDPDIVEEIGIASLFSLNYSGYEAIGFIITLLSVLSIQRGENRRAMEERLVSILPKEARRAYREVYKRSYFDCLENNGQDILEKLSKEDFPVKQNDEYYFQMKLVDSVICSLDDKSLQRLLRDVTNGDIALSLRGLSGEARHLVFVNMSKRLAVSIAEDMDFMGEVRMRDVCNASMSIMKSLTELIRKGEIICKDGPVLCYISEMISR